MDNIRVIVADDHPLVLEGLCRVLENEDDLECVGIARGERPALILMDLMMPAMDGYTACSAIKADPEIKVIPVIILTAIDHELNKKFAVEMGADGYITKPFTVKELKETITPLLNNAA
jgi:two-component system alkaline phosphatase synthesis response regulator PhoP